MHAEEPAARRRRLRWWHGALFFLAALGAQFAVFALIIVLQLTGALGTTPAQIEAALYSPPMLAGQVVVTCAILVTLALLASRLRGSGTRRTLRLGRSAPVALVIAVLGVVPVGVVIDQVTYGLHLLAPGVFDAAGLGTFVQIFATASTGGFVLATIAVSVGPALGEELFFRGLVLRTFIGDMPKWAAVVVSSALFGILHLDMLQGTGAGLIGAYLGLVVLATDSIWPAVLAHGLNNLLCSVFARVEPDGIGQAFLVGHPPWLVAICAVLAAGAVFALLRMSVRAGGSSASPPLTAR
jgi:membrane protease YdiL (CAAX protease family)